MTEIRAPIEITGVLDLEASSWTRFALGVTYDGFTAKSWWGTADVGGVGETWDGPVPVEEPGLDSMIDYLRTRGGIWWAHGSGVYDGLCILERARVRGIPCQIDRSQGRVTRITMGSLQIRDSYGLWPVPLDDIAGALRRPVPHLPWACVCGKRTCTCGKCGGCGGYCRISEMVASGDPDLVAYCTADCVTLYDGLHALRDFTQKHKIPLRGTLGQTAWVSAKDELGIPASTIPWHLWREVRKSDRGGRTAIVRPLTENRTISHHDICNAYPAQLARAELPVGNARELAGAYAVRAIERAQPGVYSMTLSVPEDLFIPPLPWTHGGANWFPVGEITGMWPLPELIAAFERGVKIVKAHGAILWDATAPIFAPLVERWYAIRKAAGRKTPFGQWIGRLAKAITGKLAERPERERAVMHPESIKVCLRSGPCRNGCTGRCGAYKQLDLFGEIYGIPYQRLGESAYPQWSAYLRAMTRVQWLGQAEIFGKDLCFGNTDSLWTLGSRKPEPLGDDLGQWEFQGAWSSLEIRSPSVYACRELAPGQESRFLLEGGDREPEAVDHDVAAAMLRSGLWPGEAIREAVLGRLHVRGIPHATEEDWKRGSGAIDRGVVTFGRAVAGTKGLFSKRHRAWSLPTADERTIYGDREIGGGGVTYPLHVTKIREIVAAQRRKFERRQEDPKKHKRGKRRRAGAAR